jgi:hypothetical protein
MLAMPVVEERLLSFRTLFRPVRTANASFVPILHALGGEITSASGAVGDARSGVSCVVECRIAADPDSQDGRTSPALSLLAEEFCFFAAESQSILADDDCNCVTSRHYVFTGHAIAKWGERTCRSEAAEYMLLCHLTAFVI